MNFQQRIALITSMTTDFLRQYQRPTHLDDAGCLKEIGLIAEEINNMVSTSLSQEGFRDRINSAFKHLRRTYSQRAWPMPSHFVKAMEATTVSTRAIDTDSEWKLDPIKINANRIKEGEPIGDSWLWGKNAKLLVKSGLVSRDEIEARRNSLFEDWSSVYGVGKALEMRANMDERHEAA
jgi:hypothetical protein